MRRIVLPGAEMAVADRGDRPPLLLLHGFPFDHELWDPQVEAFRSHRRVIAPDLVGFGRSTPVGRVSLDEHADDLASMLDATAVQSAVIVAMSMGGYVALTFWRRHPRRVAGLVLASTRAGPDTEAGRAGRYQMAIAVSQHGVAVVADALLPRLTGAEASPLVEHRLREIMHRQPREGVIAALKAMAARPSSTADLPRIAVPTLVISGTDDHVIPSSESEAIASAVAGSRLAMIPGAGHVPNLEEPGAFNAALRAFLATVDED